MKNMKKKFLLNFLLIIFIATFIFSGYNVFIWLKSDRETKALEEGLYSEVVTQTNNIEENGVEETKIDFETLKNTNQDIIGWIKIDNTYINYPILKSDTDEYYLRKDIYKNYSVSGSIFVDSKTDINFEDDNTVIYGHNMKNQRMFANLHNINNGNLGNDITVEIFLPSKNIKYKVFASYIVEPTEELIQKNFENQEKKEKYINNAIKKSGNKYDSSNINYENNIITLITCDNNNKRRVVVHAIKI